MLHLFGETRQKGSIEETGILIYKTIKIVEDALKDGNTDYYAFIVPIVKAPLEKSKVALELELIPSSSQELMEMLRVVGDHKKTQYNNSAAHFHIY